MIADTSFIYEKLKLKSFYGTIARVGVIEKKIIKEEKRKEIESQIRQIIITSLESMSIENLFKIKQAHWNIEMQHWLLDMQLNEDKKKQEKIIR